MFSAGMFPDRRFHRSLLGNILKVQEYLYCLDLQISNDLDICTLTFSETAW